MDAPSSCVICYCICIRVIRLVLHCLPMPRLNAASLAVGLTVGTILKFPENFVTRKPGLLSATTRTWLQNSSETELCLPRHKAPYHMHSANAHTVFALKVRSLLLSGVQDPSNKCLLHTASCCRVQPTSNDSSLGDTTPHHVMHYACTAAVSVSHTCRQWITCRPDITCQMHCTLCTVWHLLRQHNPAGDTLVQQAKIHVRR
jgi:hypothetical protein